MKTIICGIPFQIVEKKQPFSSAAGRFGECDTLGAKIKINRYCSKEQKEATLVHEWVHAIAGCNGVDISEAAVGILATEFYREGFRVNLIEDEVTEERK